MGHFKRPKGSPTNHLARGVSIPVKSRGSVSGEIRGVSFVKLGGSAQVKSGNLGFRQLRSSSSFNISRSVARFRESPTFYLHIAYNPARLIRLSYND
jgi:hypothetical protein